MALKQYIKSIRTALVCFLIVVAVNFLLPRLLPGDPIAYLTGFAEEEMTPTQYAYYARALHLDEPVFVQFCYYLKSLVDGTLGYSYKKETVVSALILERLGFTLQVTLPAVVISTVIGLAWGLHCGYQKGSLGDKLSSTALIVLNAVPTFVIGLMLIILFCFRNSWFPYTGISAHGVESGSVSFYLDRLHHLFLPVATLVAATVPSRFLLMRNTASKIAEEKYILYAKERGLSPLKIKFSYILPNIAQPFITMVGMSVSTCVGGSLVIETIFSIPGMGRLLTEAVYALDYPLMQGILFVTTLIMVAAIVITDALCIFIDPKLRRGGVQ